MSTKELRFAVTAPEIGSMDDWVRAVRRFEEVGFDTVVVSDHFTGGWEMEPLVALSAAAMATSSIRLQTGVLCNDYRHPVLTHRMAATLDRVSGGRFTLGLGAGWLLTDYHAAGIPLDAPGVRIERLAESVSIIKALFSGEPVDYDGRFYSISGLTGVPPPIQRPHPPIALGGGGPRMLRLAGRQADLVSIVASLGAGSVTSDAAEDLSAEQVARKVGWIGEGMREAGRDDQQVTISINHWLVRVTPTVEEADAFLERIAARKGADPRMLAASPAVLVGTVDQLADRLQERRDRFGISHFQLDAGVAARDVADLFPLVERMAGR